jgi:hypothetical protein
MPQSDPISATILQMAVQIATSAKGQTVDWISNPAQMTLFIDAVAKKLWALNQGRE